MAATKTKTASKSKAQPKAKAQPVAKPAPKPKVKPAKPVEQEEPAQSSTTEKRHSVFDAIEEAAERSKPLTVSQVAETFGEFGLSYLGKMLARGAYRVPGAPLPPKLSADKSAARTERLDYAKKVLAKHGKGKIEVLTKFRRRQSA